MFIGLRTKGVCSLLAQSGAVSKSRSLTPVCFGLALLVGCGVDSPPSTEIIPIDPGALIELVGSNSLDDASQVLAPVVDDGFVSTDPLSNFAVSIYAFAKGDDELLEQTRARAFSSTGSSEVVSSWIEENWTLTGTPTYFELFLNGLAREARGDEDSALRLLADASMAAGDATLKAGIENTHRALDGETAYVSMGIRQAESLTYSGNMDIVGGADIPRDDEFAIKGGSLVSYFGGGEPETADFGKWEHATISGTESVISWAALLDSGGLYMPTAREEQIEDSSDLIEITFESQFTQHAVDYWGKFKRITLDRGAGETYPILIVPHYDREDNVEILLFMAGTEFRSRPGNFAQGGGPIKFFGEGVVGKVVSEAKIYGRVHPWKTF